MTKKILNIGSFYTTNFGDRAIHESMKKYFSDRLDAEVSRFPIKSISATLESRRLSLLGKIFKAPMWLPSHYWSMWEKARDSDIVLIGGGNLIHDLNIGTPIQFFLACLSVKISGTSFFIVTIGAGPLVRKSSRLFVGIACSMSEGVIARDSRSYDELSSCPGMNNVLRKYLAPDPALLLCEGEVKEREHNPERPVVGLSVKFYKEPGRFPGGSEEAYNRYINRMKRLVVSLHDELNAEVLLFSTVLWEDWDTVKKLYSKLSSHEFVKINKIESLSEAMDLLSSVDLVVGTRLHSILLALGYRIPAIAIGNHPRFVGLYEDMNSEEYLFDIDNFSPKKLSEKSKSLLLDERNDFLNKVDKRIKKTKDGLEKITQEIYCNEK